MHADLKKLDQKLDLVISKQAILNTESQAKKRTYSVGSSEFSPATSCLQIKVLNKQKKDGFYWVKTNDMSKALKVFCDF